MIGKPKYFDEYDYKHMKMWRLMRWSTKPTEKDYNFFAKRVPKVMSFYDIYGDRAFSIIRYLILMYDKQSPHIRMTPIVEHRKKEIARVVNLDKYKYPHRIMGLHDNRFVEGLCEYLKFQDDMTWSMIVQNEEVFYSNQEQIIKQIQDSEKIKDTDRLKASELQGKLLKMQSQIRVELKALYSEFTGKDDELASKFKQQRPFSPEVVAGILEYDDEEE